MTSLKCMNAVLLLASCGAAWARATIFSVCAASSRVCVTFTNCVQMRGFVSGATFAFR